MVSINSLDSSASSRKLLLEKPFAEIWFDEKNQVLITLWKGSLSLEKVRIGCDFMTSFVREHSLQRHLSDHTELKSLLPEVQHYLVNNWFYEVESAGLRKIGVKLAKDIFAQATVRKVNAEEEYEKLQIESFSTTAQAYEWLLQ